MKKYVCYCSKADEVQIINAIKKGAKTLEDIKLMTGACTLGKCRELHPEGI